MKKPLFLKSFFIASSVILIAIGGTFLWATTIKLPDLSTFQARKIANSSKIVDRTGEIMLYDIHQSVRRTEIPLAEMGDNVKNAVVSVEDAHFYTHKGIRPTSIIRMILVNLSQGSFSQGGSTITQQVIKNTLLNNKKTVTRKFKEWVLAIKLERQFTKDQILQIYLNDAPFGGTIYGVEEAAKAFFNKPAKELTITESAYLAAMLPRPSYYSPFGKNRDELDERKNLVLKKMEEQDYITSEAYEAAKLETVSFDTAASNGIKAPHFVFYIQEMLEEKYGEDAMISGGYVIKTTIDYELQKKAEEFVEKHALQNAKNLNASNAALVSLNPNTGEILAMVGSRNYFDKEIDGAFNVATAPNRQPGSSFKPFVYAASFNKGYTPETILFDVPTEFSTSCTATSQPLPGKTAEDCYHPGNFDDKFRGPLSLKAALAQSINVPSVKLLYLVGMEDALDTARKMGIKTLKGPNQYGLSLVLGGAEVSLLDMTTAYGVFATGGIKNETVGILEIKDRKGEIVEQFTPSDGEEVLNRNTALMISDILSDNVARTPTFGSNSALHIEGVQIAAKTGTTNDNRDAWVMGYTPAIVTGVWSGNNDNKPMKKGGVAISGPLWNEFMRFAVSKYPSNGFEKPTPSENQDELKPIFKGQWLITDTTDIDALTGLPATNDTLPENRIEETRPFVQTILYWVNKSDPLGPKPNNPDNDPQFKLWNPPVVHWWNQNQFSASAQSQMKEITL